MESEKLNIENIIEIQNIRKLLINHPDLLSMFELLIVMSNNRINAEADKPQEKIIEEEYEEPILDSDSEDELLSEDTIN
tara:strand:+ start:147 stop:383 length:237 start_codon:yes stop_codon:yes gene_type:complete